MAGEEAVLRIVLQDPAAQGSATTPPAGTVAPPPVSTPPPQRPTAQAAVVAAPVPALPPRTAPFDPAAEATKRYEREERDKAVSAAYKEMYGDKPDLFEALTKAAKSGMQGDIGGLVKGVTGDGGALEAMGVGTEALAAAAPPVAIALVAKEIGDKINRAIIDGIKSEIAKAGEIATSIAQVNQDVTVPIEKLGDATSKAGEKIDEYVPLVGKLVIATGEAGKALAQLMRAIDDTAKHYEQYSVDVAMASAQAEVRQTTRDLARGQILGGNLGQYVTAKSKLENDVEDLKARILNQLLPSVTNIVRGLDVMLVTAEKSATALAIVADIAIQGPSLFVNAKKQRELLERIHRLMEKEEENIEDPTTVIFRTRGILESPLDRGRDQE